jgi:hypothetical protein
MASNAASLDDAGPRLESHEPGSFESDGSIPRVIQLHLNTFEEALRAWQLL